MSVERHLPCGGRKGVDIRVECVTPDGLSNEEEFLNSITTGAGVIVFVVMELHKKFQK